MLFLLADKSQWLKRTKNESIPVYTLIYIQRWYFPIDFVQAQVRRPPYIALGLIKLVFKESMQGKKDMRNEKANQSMLCAWLALYKVHDTLLLI